MSEHTQGDWVITSTSTRGFGSVTHVGPNDMPCGVCEVYGAQDKEPRANARLIAAAPDLLAACQMLVDWDDYGGDAVSMLEEAVEAARKAVEKSKESNDG